MGDEQRFSIILCWKAAQTAAEKDLVFSVPIFEVEPNGTAVMVWTYPAERLTVEVNHRGWVTWEHVTLTGDRKPVWGVFSFGMGIPDRHIDSVVRRRAHACGVVL